MPDPILSLQHVTKHYAVKVLDDVCFDLRRAEIHALLGSNGAGKSTLCRIIAGLTRPTSGTMSLAGKPYSPSGKQEAERLGVQIVQQELCLIPTLSVAENIMISRMPHTLGVIHRQQLRQQARAALARVGLPKIDVDAPASSLGVGQQQLVEIATALDRDCRILILDEPTSALSAAEAENLFEWLQSLRDQGIGIIYISHRLDEVARIANRITVLRDGCYVSTRDAAEVSTDEMVAWMTGDPITSHHGDAFQSFRSDQVALRAEGFSRGKSVKDVSFQVNRGERLGIAGLVGAGRSELLRLIFGADRGESGTIQIGQDGNPRRFSQPHQAVTAGLAMVTEERKRDGLLLPLSIRSNASIASLSLRFSRLGIVQHQAERTAAETMARELDVRCNHIEQPVQTLSGGNQQKVAVAKWLLRDAHVLFFDEPTRGIDIAARRKIYQLIASLAAEQKAVVIVSSDLDELLENCDRIAVMSAGKMVAIFERDDWSRDEIMQAAFSEHIGVPA